MPLVEIRKLDKEIINSYCVWMLHMSKLKRIPERVLEIGPGGTLGLGIMFLLAGSRKYIALDYKKYANEDIGEVVDGLVALIKAGAFFADDFRLDPFLDSRYDICLLNPVHIDKRATAIKRGDGIDYIAPYHDESVQRGSVDLIISQVVMEHLHDLNHAYKMQSLWLKPGGDISHFIGFQSHATANEWDGHWGYCRAVWNCIKEGKEFLINREPLSVHRKIIKRCGFEITYDEGRSKEPTLYREEICDQYRFMNNEDRSTESVLIQARKHG